MNLPDDITSLTELNNTYSYHTNDTRIYFILNLKVLKLIILIIEAHTLKISQYVRSRTNAIFLHCLVM